MEIKVDGLPDSAHEESRMDSLPQAESSASATSPVRILVELRMANGRHISHS